MMSVLTIEQLRHEGEKTQEEEEKILEILSHIYKYWNREIWQNYYIKKLYRKKSLV